MGNETDHDRNGKLSDDTEADVTPGNVATDLPRWSELGLQDPRLDGALPEGGSVADILVWALAFPGSDDPIDGIVATVAADYRAVGHLMLSGARKLEAARVLLRRADGRTKVAVSEEEQRAEALREE